MPIVTIFAIGLCCAEDSSSSSSSSSSDSNDEAALLVVKYSLLVFCTARIVNGMGSVEYHSYDHYHVPVNSSCR